MQPGDIIFSVKQEDDSATRAFIRAGQLVKAKVFSQDTTYLNVVHPAIAVSDTLVIESVGEGLSLTDLSIEKPPRSAMVFSCVSRDMGEAAALAAKQFYFDKISGDIRGRYSVWNAMISAFRRWTSNTSLVERINESVAIGSSSFCSQFAANCYEVGNLYNSANLLPPPPAIFGNQPSAITPAELATFCDASAYFYFAGFWQDNVEVRL
ncbi:hypothetical protein ACMSI6_10995 [Pseudomonas antarctica]|uniref:Permuted papain-like amidase enzyme, YaeF/YiiX, C92 family n=1 Tax=Pseudomonas antarctica TaxID=219572 RepID=A0A1G9VAL6_9PSED|nr:hypothetical protein [Pseudomonas antarctica]KAF2408777.1 hypothetical protein PSAN_11750 [Pseudomonas antarctica]SDM69268.1 hypothetical protein SAMN04490179_0509 [Pseudomonas antarctica]